VEYVDAEQKAAEDREVEEFRRRLEEINKVRFKNNPLFNFLSVDPRTQRKGNSSKRVRLPNSKKSASLHVKNPKICK
jgi:hypothetical protein